ncbi:hypothetical protein [Desulfolithobacter sp.]
MRATLKKLNGVIKVHTDIGEHTALVTYNDDKVQITDMKTALDRNLLPVKKIETIARD